jgi:hypothetical protein
MGRFFGKLFRFWLAGFLATRGDLHKMARIMAYGQKSFLILLGLKREEKLI